MLRVIWLAAIESLPDCVNLDFIPFINIEFLASLIGKILDNSALPVIILISLCQIFGEKLEPLSHPWDCLLFTLLAFLLRFQCGSSWSSIFLGIVFSTATMIDHFRAEASIVMSIRTANLMIIGKTYDLLIQFIVELLTFNNKFIQDALQWVSFHLFACRCCFLLLQIHVNCKLQLCHLSLVCYISQYRVSSTGGGMGHTSSSMH